MKEETECSGDEVNKGYIDTIKNCAAKCQHASKWFAYGNPDERCSNNGCKCLCEVPGANSECVKVDHKGYNLYELSATPGPSPLPVYVLCACVHACVHACMRVCVACVVFMHTSTLRHQASLSTMHTKTGSLICLEFMH